MSHALTAVIAFVVGVVFAAGMSDHHDKRMAKAGYYVIGEQAYRMTPMPSRE